MGRAHDPVPPKSLRRVGIRLARPSRPGSPASLIGLRGLGLPRSLALSDVAHFALFQFGLTSPCAFGPLLLHLCSACARECLKLSLRRRRRLRLLQRMSSSEQLNERSETKERKSQMLCLFFLAPVHLTVALTWPPQSSFSITIFSALRSHIKLLACALLCNLSST